MYIACLYSCITNANLSPNSLHESINICFTQLPNYTYIPSETFTFCNVNAMEFYFS